VHNLAHYSPKLCLLFVQLQRHAASKIVATRVKSDQKLFTAFASWTGDTNFLSEFKLAVANPLAHFVGFRQGYE
jgi:hypothetical protein